MKVCNGLVTRPEFLCVPQPITCHLDTNANKVIHMSMKSGPQSRGVPANLSSGSLSSAALGGLYQPSLWSLDCLCIPSVASASSEINNSQSSITTAAMFDT